jgi:hypothetical protein
MRKRRYDLPLGRIWAVEGKTRARCSDNLLLLCSCKLSEDSLGNGGWRLYRQAVHEHGGGRRHGAAGAQRACAAFPGLERGSETEFKPFECE